MAAWSCLISAPAAASNALGHHYVRQDACGPVPKRWQHAVERSVWIPVTLTLSALAAASSFRAFRQDRRLRLTGCAGKALRRSAASRRGGIREASKHHVSCAATATADAAWRPWADAKGIDSAKLEVGTCHDAFGNELRGMLALESLQSDDAVLTVPADCAFQVTTAGECPTEQMDDACWRRLEWWGQLSLLLLLEKKKGSQSALAPWLQTLPEVQEMLLTWSDEELSLLDYPALEQRVQEQRAEMKAAYEEVCRGCDVKITESEFRAAVQLVRSRAFSGPYEGRGASERVAQVGTILALLTGGVASGVLPTESALNGAFLALLAIPLTDFFVGQSARLKRHVLCPVVDYLNHDSAIRSDIAYEYFQNAFSVRIQGTFSPGDEVRINYGEKRSNDDLLQYYGFVEPNCKHDVYRMDLLTHLDAQASASGAKLPAVLSRAGPDEASLAELRSLLGEGGAEVEDTLVWKAVALACESELERRRGGTANELEAKAGGVAGLAARFRAEKEKVLLACKASAEARCGRKTSAAPLSLTSRSLVVPVFEEAAQYRHEWADAALTAEHAAALQTDGYCVISGAFSAELAQRCLSECVDLDSKSLTTMTTNRCNRGSRSAWLEFGKTTSSAAAGDVPPPAALTELSKMLAGLPQRANELGALEGPPLQVHAATMIAVYPELAAEYSLHKDSYAPADNDPATGASRRLTVLAYFNDWQEGDGGELRLHESERDMPDGRRFKAVAPAAGRLVIFDSRRVWHAVAPSQRGGRWAATLWVH
eukprot:TRINITY_DN90189_c0_g1_i1.p1 TRINITY_DN90189_c0_g1~~TRINITY_DN90189_c0_g1_i1.p1  ORF type:complete len:769 (+),score=181.07 TRINITY_DN90189_c0_g1_i1:62-2368(+)